MFNKFFFGLSVHGMVDINRRPLRSGKEKKRKIETTGQKYNVRICYTGRP